MTRVVLCNKCEAFRQSEEKGAGAWVVLTVQQRGAPSCLAPVDLCPQCFAAFMDWLRKSAQLPKEADG